MRTSLIDRNRVFPCQISYMATLSTLRHSNGPFGPSLRDYLDLFRSRFKQTSKTTRLIGTLGLLVSIIAAGYGGMSWKKSRAADTARSQRLLRRNSGLRGKDGSRTIFVPYRASTAKVVIYPTKPTTFDAHRRLFLNPPKAARLDNGTPIPHAPPPQVKPGLNLAFLHQYLSLMSIMIPRWNSKESGLLLSQGAFLMLRTYLSLVVARLDGEIVQHLVTGQARAFCKWTFYDLPV